MHHTPTGSSHARKPSTTRVPNHNMSGTTTAKQFPAVSSTSSAFSANANPDEDWTQVTDLAERRRIQNRIAQRNYRKKLKRRIEFLERKAGSESASPEQRHVEPASNKSGESSLERPSRRRGRADSIHAAHEHALDSSLGHQYVMPTEDRNMFSQHHTRQISTSPPPFSYHPSASADGYASYEPYEGTSSGFANGPGYGQFPQPQTVQQHPAGCAPAQYMSSPQIKSEFYGDQDMSPFGMNYASAAVAPGNSTYEPAAYPDNVPSAYVSTRPHHQPYLSQQQHHQTFPRPSYVQAHPAPQPEAFRSMRSRSDEPPSYFLPSSTPQPPR